MHFYISFIFTCVLIYTNMKGCLSFGNPSILKTSLFVHILDISATWIQQIALFFPFGNLKCWHVMTYPKESLLKTNEMLKTALSSFILVHRHVTGCVRWRMKHFLTDTKRSQKWITFLFWLISNTHIRQKCHFRGVNRFWSWREQSGTK